MKSSITVPSNSAVAIIDRSLRKAGLSPRYLLQEYIDTLTGKKETGLILDKFEGYNVILPEGQEDKLGILGFVNGKEPGEGSIPLHEIFPKENDELAIAYIIQGIYKGDFGTNKEDIVGLHLVHEHKVISEDLTEGEYILQLKEVMVNL